MYECSRPRHADRTESRMTESTESDELLLERWRQKDQKAFDLLFLRHYGHVFRVLYPLVGSREEAEDLAQETFLALHDRPPRPSGAGVGAWLRRVALNAGYNAVRAANRARRRLERCAVERPDPPAADPQVELLRAEEIARVRAALAKLPQRQAEILLLRQAGASYAEVAAVLQVAPVSVGTLLARAESAFLKVYEAEPATGQQRRGAAGDVRSLL